MLLFPLPRSPFPLPCNQGPSCQVKFSEQNHKVLAAARISALDTGEKERPVMW